MLNMPVIIENSGRSSVAFDLMSRLLKDRIIMLIGEIDDDMAAIIVAQLLFLDNEEDEPITMYINSPGGAITAGLAIYDTMNYINADVITVCVGQAASMGAFLLAAGSQRMSLPNSTIMIHQPLGGAGGQATDIDIQSKEIQRLKKFLNKEFAIFTKQPLKKIEKDTDRDNFMTAEDAVKYGLIDSIVKKKQKKED
jgi:ATP-dependent Clp protease protease subunit